MSGWRARYAAKQTSAEAAVARIAPGESIYVGAGSAVPSALVDVLTSESAPLGDNTIIHLLTLGDAPYVAPRYAHRFRHNALFIGPNVRSAVAAGNADYTPVFLSEIARLIESRRLNVHVALLSLSAPDDDGWCSFGTHVDLAPSACRVARTILAEVNERMPAVRSPERIHVDQLSAVVCVRRELPELPQAEPRAETRAIARHIADLVPDGATLQLGIGGIPDDVLEFLDTRNDLGIHSEMFSDGVMRLAQHGNITGAKKTENPGLIVASFAMGSRALYEWMHQNPGVELRASDYVNDPLVIGRHDRMVAINTCLQIDLTGQVCSDSIGERFYSGIGGQVDFLRGAARSREGRPVLALPSTASDGTISRIVPRLHDGAGVVTTRGDVHWVVTEYGAVDLHGMNVRERALSLISIAHPKFRPWLLAEAKQRRLIAMTQPEPPMHMPLYPAALETRITLRGGTEIKLRPIKSTDESALRELFYDLSLETVEQRFFAAKRFVSPTTLKRFCTIDYEREMSLVAERTGEARPTLIGWATYRLEPESGFAEAAFLVADDWQGRGLGTILLRRLTEIAEARGVPGFSAVVLATNGRMLRVFEKCGYPLQRRLDGELIHLRIPFEGARAAWDTP